MRCYQGGDARSLMMVRYVCAFSYCQIVHTQRC